MSVRKLPNLSPSQVVELQDALLANADRLLTAALAVLELGHVGLARSLAILGMEESGKAIAIHERRVNIAYAPEGEAFVNKRLQDLWASHKHKLQLVHAFLTYEQYWFDTEPPNPEANLAYLGTIEAWVLRHNELKQRGFYVDADEVDGVLTPADVAQEETLRDVISHVHQIGWQLRLGEHIEAKSQAEAARGVPPMAEDAMQDMRRRLSRRDFDEEFYEALRTGATGRQLNNDDYRLHLPEPGSNPFQHLGKPGYEAETRELLRLAAELDDREER